MLLASEDGAWRTRYWDISDRYRKHYFATFLRQTVPAGKESHYRAVTVPFESPADRWKADAARMAEGCKTLEANARHEPGILPACEGCEVRLRQGVSATGRRDIGTEMAGNLAAPNPRESSDDAGKGYFR